MTAPTKTPILNPCAKCGNRPILEGVKRHGRIWHSVKCACGNSVLSVSSLAAAIQRWNEENSAKEVQP